MSSSQLRVSVRPKTRAAQFVPTQPTAITDYRPDNAFKSLARL
jgi:hypothetical protein